MTSQPNEAAQRYSPCREKSETLVGGVVATMKPNDQGNWVRYSLLRKAEAEIASLRSALAAAEKDRAASARDWEAALSAHDRRAEELNQALAKLAEAEKALLVIGERAVCDFDDATVGDVDRVVTDHMKYKDWLRSVMTAASERDRLDAQLAEARGLFPLPGEPAAAAEILDGVIDFFESLRDPGPCHRDHHGGCQEHGYLGLSPTEKCPMEEIPERLEWLRGHQKWLRDVAAFLAPPSDRGAEGEK